MAFYNELKYKNIIWFLSCFKFMLKQVTRKTKLANMRTGRVLFCLGWMQVAVLLQMSVSRVGHREPLARGSLYCIHFITLKVRLSPPGGGELQRRSLAGVLPARPE